MRLFITLVVLMVSAWHSVAAAAAPGVTRFELLGDGSIVVQATVQGAGPYRFVLDTGSSRTVITTKLWKSLRLAVVAKTPMVTPGGRGVAYVVNLPALAIDRGPAASVAAAVLDADGYAAGQPIDGLIGQDVLSAAAYTIDFKRRVIVWHAPGETPPGMRLPLNVRDNRVLVNLAQRDGDPQPLALIPDSGSDSLVLFAHARDKVRLTKQLEAGTLSGLLGVRPAWRVQFADLMVGDLRLDQPMAVLVDTGESAELMGDGLLPLHIFSRVTFNVGERYLVVHR